jgi:hypothetical protein
MHARVTGNVRMTNMQVVLSIHAEYPPALHLGFMGGDRIQHHRRNNALLTIAVCVGLVPIFPVAIVALWNVFKPRRALSHPIAHRDVPSLPSSSSMLPAPPTKDGTAKGVAVADKGEESVHSLSEHPPSAIMGVENGRATIRYAIAIIYTQSKCLLCFEKAGISMTPQDQTGLVASDTSMLQQLPLGQSEPFL